MADLSNKALALLLLIAIVTSIGTTTFMLTKLGERGAQGDLSGRATTGTAQTTFSINSQLSIRFINSVVPFGSGYVNGTLQNNCVMGTNNSPPTAPGSGCVNFNATVTDQNLTIENDGNLLANVSLNFSSNATGFIGGNEIAPSFQYLVNNSESGACGVIQNTSSGFKEVGATETSSPGARVCTRLNFTDTADLINIAFWLRIPEDASPGAHSVTITAIGCGDGSC